MLKPRQKVTMGIDESTRHAMFTRLEEVLGKPTAVALMEHLPPVGWADVATKRDLDQLAERLDLRLEVTENRLLATFRGEMSNQTRLMVTAMVASTVSTLAVMSTILLTIR